MGEQLSEWSLPSGLQKIIFTPVGGLGSGECLVDVNMDGLQDIVVTEGHGKRNLVWFEAPLWMDVDGDDRVEFLRGNYWIQTPNEFDLPWRIFAIHSQVGG